MKRSPAAERREPFEEFIGSTAVIQMPRAKRSNSKEYGPNARMVPLSLLMSLIDPADFGNIRRLESEKMNDLCADIESRGVQLPLLVALDEQGKMCLRDGHHRVVAAAVLGIEELPVELEQSNRVKKFNIPQRVMIDWLWGKITA